MHCFDGIYYYYYYYYYYYDRVKMIHVNPNR